MILQHQQITKRDGWDAVVKIFFAQNLDCANK